MKAIFCFFVLITIGSCKMPNNIFNKQLITEVYFLSKYDTIISENKISTYFSKIYIVDKNISEANQDSIIKTFVLIEKKRLKVTADQIDFIFYKESNITNEVHLKKFPKDLDKYSQDNDMVWSFRWHPKYGDKMFSLKYYKGEIVYPKSEVIIEDIR
ncbi:MAG: hypothetical protein WCR20_23320 [Verrucomicrobiota bacterium]